MRILLQRKDSGLYFEDFDSWTSDSSSAMDFVSSTAALEFCEANKLVGTQIVLKFDEEKQEIVLPAIIATAPQGQRPTEAA
ncbi:MAG TPA: hypothetical protein P5205_17735 [Candidatus Paceibacterota bacterium]|nr:hypothetical protein [Verrucomicrobiota bacterium]HSA12206.1 hypothetical protein [Candidatus Paceibacterota bacterium]